MAHPAKLQQQDASTASQPPSGSSRRQFLVRSLLATVGLALGKGLLPTHALQAAAQNGTLRPSATLLDAILQGKHPELVVLSERPLNAETPPHLLDDRITPADKVFVRNNGLVPENIDASKWTLTVEGEGAKKKIVFTLTDLKKKFPHHTYQLQHECGGNGRAEFNPPGKGNQWGNGAVACCAWTGVRVKDLLQAVGLRPNAVYVAYYGKDPHLSGDPGKVSISRGVPVHKAQEEESLLAWAMNGQDIPLLHGYPLRLVFGGWPASVSGKWVNRIVVRDRVHDGAKMSQGDYMVPVQPLAPGARQPADKDMRIIESMPVKSLITYPRTGAMFPGTSPLELRGHAWAGDREVREMHVSLDFGATWQRCTVEKPANRLAWQHWKTRLSFPGPGYFEVWARATDSEGVAQPMVVPAWNPGGYLNNACHRIAVQVS